MLPMQDAAAAIETLDEAILTTCCAASACTRTSPVDRSRPRSRCRSDRRIDELGVPLVLHPANTSMAFDLGLHRAIEVGASWMWETSAAALSLIVGGVLDECRRSPCCTLISAASSRTWSGESRPSSEACRRHHQATRRLTWRRLLRRCRGSRARSARLAINTYGLDRVAARDDFPFLDPSRTSVSPRALPAAARADQAPQPAPFPPRVGSARRRMTSDGTRVPLSARARRRASARRPRLTLTDRQN